MIADQLEEPLNVFFFRDQSFTLGWSPSHGSYTVQLSLDVTVFFSFLVVRPLFFFFLLDRRKIVVAIFGGRFTGT